LNRFAPDLPYKVVIFAIGIFFSIGTNYSDFQLLGDSIRLWSKIPSNLILFIFLPPLVFYEAMELNVRHFQRTVMSSLLVSLPGSILGTFALAASVKVMLSYNWGWDVCCIVGAILCATDPVAVVALLKEVGCSPRFVMLITLEALINDGLALVLFEIFLEFLRLEHLYSFSLPEIVRYFVLVLIVSPLLGVAFGLGTTIYYLTC
jgi:NhaP-type Na+/H+ or K+/H+ antiporter